MALVQLVQIAYRGGGAVGVAALLLSFVRPVYALELDESSMQCQECHAATDFQVYDPVQQRNLSLTIDTAQFLRGSHGKLPCRACHERGYDELPHRGPARTVSFRCIHCHREDRAVGHLQFAEHAQELKNSVHGSLSEGKLDCDSCHDTHTFRPVREEQDPSHRISQSNSWCLRCHGPEPRDINYPALPNILDAHSHLPNRKDHFRKVKCVGCHTPLDSPTKHDVMPKKQATRDCVACHRRDSAVLSTVYTRPGEADGDVTSNAYVVGSTRSAWLDRLSQWGFAAALLGILLHAMARGRWSRTGGAE